MKDRGGRAKIINVIAGLLLAIVSLYYSSSTMFYHVHTVNGVEVVHSHFFGTQHSSKSADGGHSTKELSLIEHLNDIIAIRGEQISAPEHYSEREYNSYVAICNDATHDACISLRSSRAPPQESL